VDLMTKPVRFSATDLTRAIRAFEKAGLQVARGRITPDGTIEILTDRGEAANDSLNPLDRLLHG
jgi:hypothetical protein